MATNEAILKFRKDFEMALANTINEDTNEPSVTIEEAHEIAFGYTDDAIADIMKNSSAEEYAEMYLM